MDRKLEVERLLSAKAVADVLGVSKRQIFRLNSNGGKIPAPVRIGGSVRWRRSDIEKWIEWGCCSASEFRARKEVNHND